MIVFIAIVVAIVAFKIMRKKQYENLEAEALLSLGFSSWNIISYVDEYVTVKSRQTLEKYDDIKFFKENKEKLPSAEARIQRKRDFFSPDAVSPKQRTSIASSVQETEKAG